MRDILDELDAQRRQPKYRIVDAELGMLVEDRSSGFCGDVITITAQALTLRDRNGATRMFRYREGAFLIEGKPVTVIRSASAAPKSPSISNSGSLVDPTRKPAVRMARASRIWVEGRHDAELLEHVWGDDLRELGIVVEPMHGLDDVVAMVAEFHPAAHRRLGILVDHLVTGSKEDRLTRQVAGQHVLVTGHPFVDVWEGIRPRVLGLDRWPDVPRGQPWKEGMCRALGKDLNGFWPALRNRVGSYADLRPQLVGSVERLIDFVADAADGG